MRLKGLRRRFRWYWIHFKAFLKGREVGWIYFYKVGEDCTSYIEPKGQSKLTQEGYDEIIRIFKPDKRVLFLHYVIGPRFDQFNKIAVGEWEDGKDPWFHVELEDLSQEDASFKSKQLRGNKNG